MQAWDWLERHAPTDAPAAPGRSLLQAAVFNVTTADELEEAVDESRARRIIVSQHLDLRNHPVEADAERPRFWLRLDDPLQDGDESEAVAIVGNCSAAPSPELLGVAGIEPSELAPGQCLLLVKGELLALGGRPLWLHNLYVRVQRRPLHEGRIIEQSKSGALLWMTQCVMHGDATAASLGIQTALWVNGNEEIGKQRLFAQGVTFKDLGGRDSPPPIIMNGGYVNFVNCTFTGNVAIDPTDAFREEPPAIIYTKDGDMWLRGCTFFNNTVPDETLLLASDSGSSEIFSDGPESVAVTEQEGGPEFLDPVQPDPEPSDTRSRFLSLQHDWVLRTASELGVELPAEPAAELVAGPEVAPLASAAIPDAGPTPAAAAAAEGIPGPASEPAPVSATAAAVVPGPASKPASDAAAAAAGVPGPASEPAPVSAAAAADVPGPASKPASDAAAAAAGFPGPASEPAPVSAAAAADVPDPAIGGSSEEAVPNVGTTGSTAGPAEQLENADAPADSSAAMIMESNTPGPADALRDPIIWIGIVIGVCLAALVVLVAAGLFVCRRRRRSTLGSGFKPVRARLSVANSTWTTPAKQGSTASMSTHSAVQQASVTTSSHASAREHSYVSVSSQVPRSRPSGAGTGLTTTPHAPSAYSSTVAALESSAAQQRGRLTAELDSMRHRGEKFLERFVVLSCMERREGGQAVVQFVRCSRHDEPAAVKFFLSRAAFDTEVALYGVPELRSIMPAKLAEAGNSDGAERNSRGYPWPPCIIIEKGESLQEWKACTKPAFTTIVDALCLIAGTLVQLHSNGWVHRDLKPGNVLRLPVRHSWTLMDFGLAARTGATVPLAFSPAYAPPEAAVAEERGDSTIMADPAADVWALGVMAFELLTSEPLYTPMVATRASIWAQLCGREALPWEAGAPQQAAKLSQLHGLRRGVLLCLQRDPAARPSAQEVLVQWRDLFNSRTTGARR
eukprot:jgi/Ulvmu1/5965/UM026_0088.1